MTEAAEQETEQEEKTDADAAGERHQDWDSDDRTEVDAQPPATRAPELGKPR